MRFSNESLQKLQKAVSMSLSTHRFKHTLGVVKAALHIADFIPCCDRSELVAAALLHDVTKEVDAGEAMDILKGLSDVTDDDILCSAVHHSLTAPVVIKRDFSEYATENVLSAVRNHTTADPDMSLFDEIIFISDYIEEGRRYDASISLCERLYKNLEGSRDAEEAIFHLHNATVECLENTIRHVLSRGARLHERTVAARNAFLGRRPIPLN